MAPLTTPPSQRVRVLTGLLFTLATLYLVPDRRLVLLPLFLGWWLLFRPLSAIELIMFGVAGAFFLFQNHLALRDGLFEFRFKDILLMPYYEPFLWGFYFLSMKRFVTEGARGLPSIGLKAVAGLAATSAAFAVFSRDSQTLFVATTCSTAFLLALFHDRADLEYAVVALVLGFIVEMFGVSTGLWWYPEPDFLGIPSWFATMWISAGLLARRFLIPIAVWLAAGLDYRRA